ncbi:MAG: hypothetical protein KY476_11605 [Planctomycetes bacterium]|nr:hypothetical protein [Planctomycetota bacterium]
MNSSLTISAIGILTAGLLGFPAAAGQPSPADADAVARHERLEFMKQAMDEFTLTRTDQPDQPLPRTKQPVLRFDNQIREALHDGGVFLWLEGKRPVAAATVSIRNSEAVYREFCSLSAEPLRCERAGTTVWTPQSGALLGQPLPRAPAPAGSETQRLIQMRRLAGRFSVTHQHLAESSRAELRLLTQPVYRFSQQDAGVVDGALFAFSQGTDPEVLVLIEAFRESSGAEPLWRYSLGRQTSLRLIVRLDGQEIWSAEMYWRNPRSPNDPYQEGFFGKYEPPGTRAAGATRP